MSWWDNFKVEFKLKAKENWAAIPLITKYE